jgi:chromosome segregation ATPase
MAEVQSLAKDLEETQADILILQDGIAASQAELAKINVEIERMGEELTSAHMALTLLRDDVDGLGEDMLGLKIQLGAMESQLAALGEQLLAVRRATQRFDTFLNGLRQLLLESQEEVIDASPTPDLEPASTAPASSDTTPEPMVTVIPLATPTP